MQKVYPFKILIMGIFIILACPLPLFASEAGKLTELEITHRMMYFAIQVGIILIAARLGNTLFEHILHLPGVLGELVAGIIIGPYALGAIPLIGFPHGLFPLFRDFPISPELYALSTIASIVLLFTVGLETDLGLLLRYTLAGFLVGAGGVIASFLLGALSLSLLSEPLLGRHYPMFSPIGLFAGIVSTATSVGITARILSEKRKLDSPEGVTILSAAVIDDVIGIILLAIVMGIVGSAKRHGEINWAHIGTIALRATGVWVVVTGIGLLFSQKISAFIKLFRLRTVIATISFALALILAGLFEHVGLAMIIGAYVMGLTLSNSDIKHLIRERVDQLYEFLVPIFFCVIGMQLNIRSIISEKLLIFAAIYTVVAIISKVVGCGLPAIFANFNILGALRIGCGMVPRGEVGLIIAGIGLATEIISQELFGAFVIMVAVNTLIAPPLLVLLFKKPKSGVRKELKPPSTETKLSFDFPSQELADFFISKLVGLFETAGFFVHCLNRQRRLYECRKDGTVFDFECPENTLTFTCHKENIPLIKAAMLEAFANLEQAISDLRKPLDAHLIGDIFQETTPKPTRERLSLAQFITKDAIVPHLRSNTKEGIIKELIEALIKAGKLDPKFKDHAFNAVMERERTMSTGMQHGIAIPHGKADFLDTLVCAVGIKPEGVDFGSIDGKPSKIFLLTLAPQNQPAPYLQFMATVSQLLNAKGREEILKCKTKEEIYNFLTRQS